jgi:hypothetical protein
VTSLRQECQRQRPPPRFSHAPRTLTLSPFVTTMPGWSIKPRLMPAAQRADGLEPAPLPHARSVCRGRHFIVLHAALQPRCSIPSSEIFHWMIERSWSICNQNDSGRDQPRCRHHAEPSVVAGTARLIIRYGGSLANLVKDILERALQRPGAAAPRRCWSGSPATGTHRLRAYALRRCPDYAGSRAAIAVTRVSAKYARANRTTFARRMVAHPPARPNWLTSGNTRRALIAVPTMLIAAA